MEALVALFDAFYFWRMGMLVIAKYLLRAVVITPAASQSS